MDMDMNMNMDMDMNMNMHMHMNTSCYGSTRLPLLSLAQPHFGAISGVELYNSQSVSGQGF